MSKFYNNMSSYYGSSDMSTKELRKRAKRENGIQWEDVFNRNVGMLASSFKWTGLPDTVDEFFFEKTLLFNGMACILDDPNTGSKLGLPCVPASPMNLYYEHTVYRAISLGYSQPFLAYTHYNKNMIENVSFNAGATIDEKTVKGAVCFDNIEVYPMINTLMMYTDKIVDCMRAIDVVAKLMKTPRLIETDEASKTAIQSALRYVDENIIAVYARKDIAKAIKDSQSIETGASPQILDILWAHYNNLYSAFYTAFGINNLNTNDKKERLLTNEIESNDEAININIQHRLEQRKHFCENYKAAFGGTIDVELRYKQEDEGGDYIDPRNPDIKRTAEDTEL